jgi:hypothetical protein
VLRDVRAEGRPVERARVMLGLFLRVPARDMGGAEARDKLARVERSDTLCVEPYLDEPLSQSLSPLPHIIYLCFGNNAQFKHSGGREAGVVMGQWWFSCNVRHTHRSL